MKTEYEARWLDDLSFLDPSSYRTGARQYFHSKRLAVAFAKALDPHRKAYVKQWPHGQTVWDSEADNMEGANMTTKLRRVDEIRVAFWRTKFGKGGKPQKYRGLTQNQLPADLRAEFVAYVDHLAREGAITERLASRVTL